MDPMKHEKVFVGIALGGIVTILIVGIVLAVLENRSAGGDNGVITGKAGLSEASVINYEMVGSEPEMVIVSNWEDVEVSEVVTEDTEEKRTINLRLDDVRGMVPDENIGYIFVGDSRFVNMNDVCEISKEDNLFMVAKVGEGYSWFSQTALKQIKRIVSSGLYSEWKLVICLGINDLGSINNYLKKYEELKSDYDITLVSVNPVNNYPNISNSEVEKFNSSLKEVNLPYINTYNILMTTGYSTTDGLHYSPDTTRKIYDGILLGLEEISPGTLKTENTTALDKTGQSKKKSIQSEILAENKYVRKTPVVQAPANSAAAGTLSAAQAQSPAPAAAPAAAPATAEPSPEEMERILREIEEFERSQQGEQAPPEEPPQEQPPEEQPPEENPPEEEGDG